MVNAVEKTERSKLGIWIQAMRAFSFTASMIPVVLGAVLALSYSGDVNWFLFPIVVVCSLFYHAATNLISDYFDYVKNVDSDYTFGSSKVIVEGLLTAKQVLAGGWILFAAATLLGMALIAARGFPIFVLGVIGMLGGYLYTGKPIGYKYVALGDLFVFVLMGPLMVIGSYYVLTGAYDNTVLLVSLPIGFLVAAILHANNLRDITHDAQAHVKTVANLLGLKASKIFYVFLLVAAYVAVILMVTGGVVTPWSLIVLVSLPPALKTIKVINSAKKPGTDEIALIDVQTAQLHLLFGLLFAISIAVGAVIA